MITISPATTQDAELMAPLLRKADMAEIQASLGEDPKDCLMDSVRASHKCFVAKDEDGYIAMWGVVTMPGHPQMGIPWMTATDALEKYSVKFLREAKDSLQELQEGYTVLTNFVDARNHVHIRWLQWMGFTFIGLRPKWGVEQRPFIQFMRLCRV